MKRGCKRLVVNNDTWEIETLSMDKWITRIKYYRAFSIRIIVHTN